MRRVRPSLATTSTRSAGWGGSMGRRGTAARAGAGGARDPLALLGGFGGGQGPDGNGSGGGPGGLGSWPLIVGTMVVLAILAFLGVALGRGEMDPVSGNESPQGEEQPGEGD